ncbi:MAG: hypothetical protein C0478_13210 [Planctomyces sp.]|nr:hypothetical protein [Planctomyces sp.]
MSVLVLLVQAGTTSIAGDGPRLWSKDWWADRSTDPPGTRQVYKDGKHWPPYARPTGRGQTFVHQYHHAHYWPIPYRCEDESSVRNALAIQANNGWADATTIHEYHFDAETNTLNSSGLRQVHWVLTSAPPEYRSLYVAKSGVPEVDQARMAQLQQAVGEIDPSAVSLIQERIDNPSGRPAREIDRLRNLELQSMPTPRLQMTVGVSSGAPSSGAATSTGNMGSPAIAP